MKIYGTAGASASMLEHRRQRLRQITGIAVGAGVIGGILVGRPMAALFLAVMGFLVRYRLRGLAYAARAGAKGEADVAERLRAFRPDVLIFDLNVRQQRSDIDAVVLGPMVATIEVKAARGRVRAMSDGTIRVGGVWLQGHPIGQAARHASSLGDYTEHHVEAVLCITAMRGRPRYVEYGNTEVLLTSTRYLRRTLRRLPRVIKPAEARQIARLVRSGNNPSHPQTPSVH